MARSPGILLCPNEQLFLSSIDKTSGQLVGRACVPVNCGGYAMTYLTIAWPGNSL
jgi:hypothetical protein